MKLLGKRANAESRRRAHIVGGSQGGCDETFPDQLLESGLSGEAQAAFTGGGCGGDASLMFALSPEKFARVLQALDACQGKQKSAASGLRAAAPRCGASCGRCLMNMAGRA